MLDGLYYSLDDFSWTLLERLRLDGFFEDHGIPPVLFPLAILALAVFLLLAAQPAEESPPLDPCGDGECDPSIGEDVISCPADCKATAREDLSTVTVELAGVKGTVDVRLEDVDREIIGSAEGRLEEFVFTGVPQGLVVATARNPENGKTASSDYVDVDSDEALIVVNLPGDFFEEAKGPPKATLRVVAKDMVTSDPVTAKVTVVIPHKTSHSVVTSGTVAGADYFTLDANQWYALLAEAEGYGFYDSTRNPFMLEAGQERGVEVLLTPQAVDGPASLSVCVRDQEGGIVSGAVRVYGPSGSELGERALAGGCAAFDLKAGGTVTASTKDLPANCLDASAETTLVSGENRLDLNVTCGPEASGRVRVKVLDENGTVRTQDAAITAWYDEGGKIYGSGPAGALAMGPEEHTEYVKVEPMDLFYFMVAGLEGYETHTSQAYSVPAGEDRSITLEMEPPLPPEYEFTFSGVTVPNPVVAGSEFTMTVSKILYGQTDITPLANITVAFSDVSVELAGQPCSVEMTDVWRATCAAPPEPGEHDLAISASYNERTGTEVVQINVMAQGRPSLLELVPHTILDLDPPIEMGFDIFFNGSPLDSLSESEVSVFYEDGGCWLPEHPAISGRNGTYSMRVDTPYAGRHLAEMRLMKLHAGAVYEKNFTLHFESERARLGVSSEQTIDPFILEPSESFTVLMRLTYGSEDVAGLENLHVTVRDQRTNLPWDPGSHTYQGAFQAPSLEGIYEAVFDIGYEELAREKIYVVDTSRDRAEKCEINACEDRPDVRACVHAHRSEGEHSEDEVVRCITRGLMIGGIDISHCTSSGADRGDWNQDCLLTSRDISLMKTFFEKIPSRAEWGMYAGCGDMDNDGDVDKEDLTCLTNVVSGLWMGETGDGECEIQMNGGFCMNISTSHPGDFNDDGRLDSEDADTMRKIVRAVSKGVSPPERLLNVSDFDGDGRLGSADTACLTNITDGRGFAAECLAVFGFGCNMTPGDLTQDEVIDETDLLIERWILDRRVDPSGVFACADVTEDGALTEDDYTCIQAISQGDETAITQFCPYCYQEMQKLGRYGEEICHDGLDNDCDGETDEDCDCDAEQSCSRLYDQDSDPTTKDFLLCRAFGYRGFYGSEGKDVEEEDSEPLEEGTYDWVTVEEMEGECDEENWGRTMHCGGGSSTCLFTFEEGFTCGSSERKFGWEFAEGVIGPLCVKYDCHDVPHCPADWVKVDTKEGSSCRFIYTKKCTYCRFKYDNCRSLSCGASGTDIGGCNEDSDDDDTEECGVGTCMGTMGGTEKGLGYHDNRYGYYLLWKVASETRGTAFALIPDEYETRGISRVYLSGDPNGNYPIETAEPRDAELSGGWIYDFSMHGAHYGACYLIAEFSGVDQSKRPRIVVPFGQSYEDEYRVVWHFPTAAARYSDH